MLLIKFLVGTLLFLMLYLLQAVISVFICQDKQRPIPTTIRDLMKATFLPYIIYETFKNKNHE